MRKRKYSALDKQNCVDDSLIELIDTYWRMKREHTQDLCSCTTEKKASHLREAADLKMPIPEIHNLVGTTQMKTALKTLDLERISEMLPNSMYDKQKFAAITMRINHPFCTILLFSSGKMVLTGCRTFVDCMLASHYIVNFLRICHPGVLFQIDNIKIQNIVGNVDLKMDNFSKMDLNMMIRDYNVYCTYQKNTFPGLIYRPKKSPVVLLIFESGKIVITGGKSYHDVREGFKRLWPVVSKYVVKK